MDWSASNPCVGSSQKPDLVSADWSYGLDKYRRTRATDHDRPDAAPTRALALGIERWASHTYHF